MSVLSLDTVVRTAFYVRKRKTGSETYLIYLARIYLIDDFSEKLWDQCRDGCSIGELMRDMVEAHPTLPALDCVALVAHNILVLLECEMLTVASGHGNQMAEGTGALTASIGPQ
jgi:hypothetical protein